MEDVDFLISRWQSGSGRQAYVAITECLASNSSLIKALELLPGANEAHGLDLRGIQIVGQHIPSFALDGCDLSYGCFDGSTLERVSLTDSRLDKASFRRTVFIGNREFDFPAGMIGARAIQAVFDEARCPGIVMDCGDFSHSTFIGADLKNAQMSNAKFEGVSFERADLRGTNLSDSMCANASFQNAIR